MVARHHRICYGAPPSSLTVPAAVTAAEVIEETAAVLTAGKVITGGGGGSFCFLQLKDTRANNSIKNKFFVRVVIMVQMY